MAADRIDPEARLDLYRHHVIQLFVYPQAWPEHLVWASILSILLTRGAGALSVDHLIGLEPAPNDRPSPGR
jgi:putative oxidoreductase